MEHEIAERERVAAQQKGVNAVLAQRISKHLADDLLKARTDIGMRVEKNHVLLTSGQAELGISCQRIADNHVFVVVGDGGSDDPVGESQMARRVLTWVQNVGG